MWTAGRRWQWEGVWDGGLQASKRQLELLAPETLSFLPVVVSRCSPLIEFFNEFISSFIFQSPFIVWGLWIFPRRVLSLTTASARVKVCVCVCGKVCLSYHLQVNLQMTGPTVVRSVCLEVHVCECECMCRSLHDACTVCICFSLGNTQVPLQSQTAGCSPQSLKPWCPAGGDAPLVVCLSPAQSCQSPYDTASRTKRGTR